jgi:hypothetical protein
MDIWNAAMSTITEIFAFLKNNWDIVTSGIMALFTLVMAIATVFYAVISKRLYKVSKKQIEASKEQTEAYIKQTEALKELAITVQHIPSTFRQLTLQKEISERDAKERAKLQQRATGGH